MGNMFLKRYQVFPYTWLTCMIVTLITFSSRLSPVSSYAIKTPRDAMSYLQRFGYTEENKAKQLMNSGKMEECIERMISEFQALMGLRVTGMLDAPTLKKMNSKRCGNLDIYPNMTVHHGRNKRWNVNGERWVKRDLTFAIRHPLPSQAKLPMDAVKRMMENAARLWSNAANITLRPVLHDSSFPADIDIRFERERHSDDFPFDGPGQTVAHAFPPGNEPINGDIHFDDDEDWYFGEGEGMDEYENFAWVAAHELGHALGLSHSDIPGSIMQPEVQDYDPEMKLDEDDILGIQELYGPPPNAPPSPDTSSKPKKITRENQERANPCDSGFTVNAMTNDETEKMIYVFFGEYVYKIPYPITTQEYHVNNINHYFKFPRTSGNRMKIDAAFTDPKAGTVYLFRDKQAWIFQNGSIFSDPVAITDLFPGYNYDNVDAAFTWKDKVYLIKNNMFWEFERGSGISQFHPSSRNSKGHSLDTWHVTNAEQITAAVAMADKVYLFGKSLFWKLIPTPHRRPAFTTENSRRASIRRFFKCPFNRSPRLSTPTLRSLSSPYLSSPDLVRKWISTRMP